MIQEREEFLGKVRKGGKERIHVIGEQTGNWRQEGWGDGGG